MKHGNYVPLIVSEMDQEIRGMRAMASDLISSLEKVEEQVNMSLKPIDSYE
jgi:hypothetical protein